MMVAAATNNAFAINGFTGLTNTQIFSFLFMFILFNGYVVLMAGALASFYVTAKPRYGRVRTAAIWHFIAALWIMLAFISTVWGAPAEKSFIQDGTTNLGVGSRTVSLFIGVGFAAVGVLCMLIGFVQGARQKRELREAALAA